MKDQNEVLRELLDEGEKVLEVDAGTVKMVDDINEMMESVSALNFIESNNLLKQIKGEIDNLDSAKKLLDSIEEMDTSDINKKIMSANALENPLGDEDSTFKQDSEKFKEEYFITKKKLSELQVRLEEKLLEYKDVEMNTTFLTSELIDSVNKRLVAAKDSGIDSLSNDIKMMEKVISIYENRNNLDYLLKKGSNIGAIKKFRKLTTNNYQNTMKKSVKRLAKYFDGAQLERIEFFLISINPDKNKFAAFIAHMAHLLEFEGRHGNHTWIKVLFMNILDIDGGIYDLEGGAEAFNTQLTELYSYY